MLDNGVCVFVGINNKPFKLWELRPTNDRISFFYWQDNIFVLLHHFKKQTQKTPPREIEQANKNMKYFIERSNKL